MAIVASNADQFVFGLLVKGLSLPGAALIAAAWVIAVLVALIAKTVLPSRREPGRCGQKAPSRTKSEERTAGLIAQRLSEEKGQLDYLDAERACRGDAAFGRSTEDRIVWGELLDLELQDIDEQLSRICRSAASTDPEKKSRPGGPQGRNTR